MTDTPRWANKMRFSYHSDHNRDEGNVVKRPKIEIAIRKSPEPANASNNPELRIFGLVDSGADISSIPRSMAEIIGLDLDDATVKTTRSASGEFSTYRTTMYLEIIYKEKRVGVGLVEVAVPKTDPKAENVEEHILIGRRGFFDKYRVTFDEAQKIIKLSRIDRQ